jgi:hypothetical protein
MKNKLQAGFSAVEGLLVVVVLVAVGAVGYFALNRSMDKTASDSKTTTSVNDSEPAAPEVKTTSDLAEAEQTLDSSELDAADSELDAELDTF